MAIPNPELAQQQADAVASIYANAELSLMRKISGRLADGSEAAGWEQRKLGEVRALQRDARGILDEVNPVVQSTIENTSDAAYRAGIDAADRTLTQYPSMLPPDLAAGSVNQKAVEALARDTVEVVQAPTRSILRNTTDAYRQVIADTVGAEVTGTATSRETLQQALDKFAARGITGFTDKAGRRWKMDTYAEMAVRTASSRAMRQGNHQRYIEAGQDIVCIHPHQAPAPQCRPFEGALISLTGDSTGTVEAVSALDGETRVTGEVMMSMDEAEAQGLHHPNCAHTDSVWVPGTEPPEPPEYDPEHYRNRQRLRSMERRVRAAKRREAVATTPEAAKKARAQVRAGQARIRKHVAETGAPRNRPREQLRTGRPEDALESVKAKGVVKDDAPAAPAAPQDTGKAIDRPIEDMSTAELQEHIDTLGLEMAEATTEDETVRYLEAVSAADARLAALEAEQSNLDAWGTAAGESAEVEMTAEEAAMMKRYDEFVATGMDEQEAWAEARGVSLEKQRTQDAILQLRHDGYVGNGFEDLARQAYKDEIEWVYLQAEDACRGTMVKRAYVQKFEEYSKNKIGGYKLLWQMQESQARKWASEELLAWWDANGRVTFEDFKNRYLHPEQALDNTKGGDFLQ